MSARGTLCKQAVSELINEGLTQSSGLSTLKSGQKLHKFIPNKNTMKTLQSPRHSL